MFILKNVARKGLRYFLLAWPPELLNYPYILILNIEENFTQIHVPDWQFYLPWVTRQWDISIP